MGYMLDWVYVVVCCASCLIAVNAAADIQAFKATMRRETILIQRTLFVYIFKAVQVCAHFDACASQAHHTCCISCLGLSLNSCRQCCFLTAIVC